MTDRNDAYERKVIKVSINVWNCIFKSSQRIGQCYIPWELVSFCNCPWVEGILVVIPNGCWLSEYSAGERVEYEWPVDCRLASLWETSLCHILYGIDGRVMVRLVFSVFHFRVESISVTLSLPSKRFRTQRALSSLWTISTKVGFFSCRWIPHRWTDFVCVLGPCMLFP